MELYYVEIRGTLNSVLIHAELIMTHSRENAEAVAWEHLLEEVNQGCRILLSQSIVDVEITSELITDPASLGEGKTPYYTHEMFK